MEDYILKMKNVARQFATYTYPLVEDELILYILGGLGFGFEVVVVNLTSRKNLTLYEVRIK